MGALILPLLLFAIFYLVLIRPQQAKIKAQKALVARAQAGDRVMLSSGIFGTITEVVDDAAYVELADGIEILVARVHIQEILTHFPTEDPPEGALASYDDEIDEIEEIDDDGDDVLDVDEQDADEVEA